MNTFSEIDFTKLAFNMHNVHIMKKEFIFFIDYPDLWNEKNPQKPMPLTFPPGGEEVDYNQENIPQLTEEQLTEINPYVFPSKKKGGKRRKKTRRRKKRCKKK